MSDNFLLLHVNEWADFESSDALPLSQGYILANLKKHGYKGQVLGDYKNRPLTPHHFNSCLQKYHPKAIGFSVYEENINRVRAWAALAKKIEPKIPVILGGPQTTFMPSKALEQMDEVDILCRGEGETVMVEVANALAGNRPFTEVAGICCREDGTIVETASNPRPENLDDLPSPYLDGSLDCSGKSQAILLSSRGCTSACTFCYTPRANGRKVRFHSVDRVITEMQHLQQKGISDFWFADPNFAHSRERLEMFLEAIINKVPGASFWCQTRSNLVDAKLLALLKRAGAHTLAFGLESAHAETLKKIKKGTKIDELSRAIKLTQDAGIKVELFSLFGLPGESLENAQQTLDFVKRHQVDIDGNSISQQLHVFFGTPVGENPADHGIDSLPITKPAYQCLCRDFQTDSMSADEIHQMSLIWRLNRKDFGEDITNGTNLFTIAGFITRHKKYFTSRPEAEMMLARIYMHLDECGPAAQCLLRLRQKFGQHPEVEQFLNRPFIGYKSKRRALARKGYRIIFDCKGQIDGIVVPETESYFTMATLGSNTLLADFERGMDGVKTGSTTQFEVVFPSDYGNKRLAGQKVSFQAYLHQVLEPVVYTTIEEMAKKSPRNMFRFDDLFNLKKYNENLYFMVLRDSVLHSYTGNLPHLMALFNYYLKLGFQEKALDLAYSLPQEPSVLGHAGRVLLANDLPEEALEFLQKAADTSAEMENQRLKAHIKLKQYEEAEKIGADPRLATSLQTMNLRVNLASLQQLPVAHYLQRMDQLLDSQVKMMAAEI
ncbi:MAG: radical SAM protein [Proteobacteria bacterium]|nr:radical SAM protein [Pseudomonadota bacterium]MBU1061055.1 radical SAM protein [Pseudomonadota bacterium]